MNAITYIREALQPGGTPKRYLIWVSIVLGAQVIASVVPSEWFYQPLNFSHYLLVGVLLLCIGINFPFQTPRARILAAYALFMVGLAVSAVTITLGITSLTGIVFMLTWAMTLFVAERREYISFDLVTAFMVMMLLSSVFQLLYSADIPVDGNLYVLIVGAIITAIDIYLVYADFGSDKNFYKESRKTYDNLEVLSRKMSTILTADGQLEHLLGQVTQECVPFLEMEDCVIYLYDENKGRLIQVAAYGAKSSEEGKVKDPIEIEPGKGVVGTCFQQQKMVLIEELKYFDNYIIDDAERNSELSVPIISNGKTIGVIDSEHSIKGFFRERHVQAFHIMASFCGIKITEYKAKESIQQAKEAKEEAIRYKELDELKNRFITNISHDLKTPLSLIKAPAMQIAKIAEDKSIQKHSNYILKNTEHLLRVVNQLLQLNRVEEGLNELYLEDVDLDELIRKISTQYEGLAERDNINFKVISQNITIRTDAFRLEQIIHNLTHNAFRYVGKGGSVKLNVKYVNDLLKIEVEDDGPGIPGELQENVFDRFFKVDENNHAGTGIGLSLVKEYTHSLGGTIHLESEVDEGTKFTISLPSSITEDVSSVQEAEKEEQVISVKPMMLVVEDHPDLNDFICTSFEDDFNCIPAFDGVQALEQMKKYHPDIIISDLMMPKMDGTTFIKEVKTHDVFGHIPIVILSAKSQIDSKVDLYALGADNYLVKPFDIKELEAVVNSTLQQRKKIRSYFQKTLSEKVVEVVTENMDEAEGGSETVTDPFLQKAIDYVLENLDNNAISIQEMGKTLGVGRNKLQKEIKALTELTPVEFVRSIRLNEARKRLVQRDLNVSEVAYAVGFNNLSYFTRSFKAEFGMLPSEWQESH